MSPVYLVLIVLVVLLIVGYPGFGIHSWGYAPSGIIGVIVAVLILLLLLGRL